MVNVSIELLILDLREFLDSALEFIEFYELDELRLDINKVATIRQHAIEYIKTIYDLKKLLNSDPAFKQSSEGILFSDQFKNRRIFFYKEVFKRLDFLFEKLNNSLSTNDLVRLYSKTIQILIRNTNEFIGYIESKRWNKNIALQILDKLVESCNDFLAIFERLTEGFNSNRRFNSRDTNQSSTSASFELQAQIRNLPKSKLKVQQGRRIKKKRYSFCCVLLLIIICFIILFYLIVYLIHFLLNVNFYLENTFYSLFNSKSNFYVIKKSFFFSFVDKFRYESSFVTYDSRSIEMWTQVYSYMTNLSLFIICLFFYILFECFFNQRIL